MAELASVPSLVVARPGRKAIARAAALAGRALALVVLLVFAAAFVFTLLWMLSTSLKSEAEVFTVPPIWVPTTLLWSNYPEALTFFPFPLYLRNTLIITVPSILGK